MPYSHKSTLIELLEIKAKEFDKADDLNLSSYIKGLKEAQTFRLPHRESLPTVKNYKLFYEFMKSPYHSYLIEMPDEDGGWLIINVVDYNNARDNTDKIDEAEADLYNLKKKWWQTKKKKIEREKYEFPSLLCALFSYKKDIGWESFGSFSVEMNENNYKVTNKVKSWKGDDLPNKPIKELAWMVFEFMVAVNTPNIKQSEVKPPKMINAKRVKKGKPLLEGYKYLDLIPREQLSHDAAGTGAAKRMHWRRGHIRRLVDRTTWVRPALIGKGSFVDKTYRVNP